MGNIRFLVVPYTRGIGLDASNYEEVIWKRSLKVSDTSVFKDKALSYVFAAPNAISQKTLDEWWRILEVGGHLVLVIPHDLEYEQYMVKMPSWVMVENEVKITVESKSRLLVYKKLSSGKRLTRLREFDPNSALLIRYGGFGDMLQASSVIAGLKQQGWKVIANVTEKGRGILQADPNIDGWWMQDEDQVSNDNLENYWRALKERFGKIVNLSESVECRFLVPYHRPESNFSPEILRHHCAGNYNDYACDLAGIPRKNQVRFYPTADERAWAKSQRKKLGDVPVILWSLSGSSLHKAYPWTDNVIATLMLHSNAKVVMVGDNLCKLLEDGWVDEPRVIRRSGEWSIRETLSFARVADIVVGPETGVLNSVSMEADVGKVLMLSHSTEENLTRDWLNTHVLTPNVDCYPCHRLHYDFSYCRRDEETHGAACAVSIKPEDVHEAIDRLLNARGFT